jgi:hypothetical protein
MLVGMGTIFHIKNDDCRDRFAGDIQAARNA